MKNALEFPDIIPVNKATLSWQARVKNHPHLLVLLFFLLCSCVQLWPLPGGLTNTLFDLGDPADSSYRLGAIAQNLLNNPLDLYNTNALYPVPNGLALDEMITGSALLVAPLIWLTDNPVLAFNLLILMAFALRGFAMYLVVQRLTASYTGGLVAGLVFAFSPWHMSHYAHVGIASGQWMVLALYFLMLFLDAPRLSRKSLIWLGLFAFFTTLQILAAGYHAYTAALLYAFYLFYHFGFKSGLALYLWQRLRKIFNRKKIQNDISRENITGKVIFSWKRNATQFVLVGVASLIALALVIPFILPFIEHQRNYGFKRGLEETRYWSAAPVSLLRTNPQSWQYRPIQRGIFNGQTSAERALYPGVVAVLLGLVGLASGRKLGGARWPFGTLALAGFILSLGPTLNLEEYGRSSTGITLPYAWLYNTVPGWDALRVPLRFGHVLMAGLAVCAGYGAAQLVKIVSRKGRFWPVAVAFLCVVLVAVDFFAPGWPFNTPPNSVGLQDNAPEMYRWLANNPEGRQLIPENALIVQLPLPATNGVNTRPDYLLYALDHKRPMLNGSANILPHGYRQLLNELDAFPSDRTLDVLEGLQVQFVLVSPGELSNRARQTLAIVLQKGERLELVREFVSYQILKVKPSGRYETPARLLPPKARVLLAEDATYKSLYLQAASRLLGDKCECYSLSRTVYDDLLGVRPAKASQSYDFMLVYGGANPARWGFASAELVWENEVAQLYRRL